MIISVNHKTLADVTLADPEIKFETIYDEFYVYFCAYGENSQTRVLAVLGGDTLTLDNQTFTIPKTKDRKEFSDFINTLKIYAHNEYMEQLIDTL